ncbi:M3 family oligoendopeptidase [Pleurocapsa sp. PCC 7319]|uniref:M3 family oligoendopeptidase n=1 Tax=Pleurocapsa sp. PCC 7319 TaxID=118161 RepID=UPI00034C6664|nr:M3 family oligoendopeptidase [Pleurocapsa sp. PCC 7319]
MSQTTINFKDIEVETPTIEQVTAEYQNINTNLDQATTLAAKQEALQQWENLRRRLDSWTALTSLHFSQDTANEAFKQAQEYSDELQPKLTALEIALKRRLLDSKEQAELESILGKQAFSLWSADVTTFESAIEDDLVQESKLVNQYVQLLASAKIEFQGETVNLSGIRKYTQDSDRQTRYQAEKARWNFFSQHQSQLDSIYDQLVKLRHGMAQKLGYDNYIGLGYKRMQRVDYNETDVESYRNEVVAQVVPLAQKIMAQKAAKLNLDRVMFWDESVFDLQGNPKPQGDHDWMLQQAQQMFDAMHPELGSFFKMMVGGNFLDLKTRPGKAGGGFCTSFPTAGVPYIFANFNSTKGDVEVFTHEMGHAFQAWQSRDLPLIDYLWPTLESCEIHSMSLEFLTWSQMDKFFADDADRFREIHLAESLLFLPYGCAVDHFQHLVYTNPQATPQERNQMWQQMEARYLPWRQYGDLAYPAQGGLWQEKQHIYCSPFYYIDYTLALCCAMQFWLKSEANFEDALTEYIALCQRGGQAPFQELVSSANLVSPFKPGSLADVVEKAQDFLGL